MPSVLIIENDETFAGELQRALVERQYDAAILSDGGLAVAHVGETLPDLIVLCAELPKISGFSVCNRLKRETKLAQIPIIILSASSSEETFDQHRKLPTKRANEYLHKPVATSELMPLIERLIAERVGAEPVVDKRAGNAVAQEATLAAPVVVEPAEKSGVMPQASGPESAIPMTEDDFLDLSLEEIPVDEGLLDAMLMEGPEPERSSVVVEVAKRQDEESELVSSTNLAIPVAQAEELEAFRAQLDAAEQRVRDLEGELRGVRELLRGQQAELARLELLPQELEQARAELEAGNQREFKLQEKIQKLEQDLEGAHQALEVNDAHVRTLEQTGSEREAEIASLQAQLEQTQTQLEQTQAQLEQTQAELGQTQAQSEQTRAQLEQAQAELGQMQAQSEQTRAQLEQAQAELGQMQAQSERTRAQLEQTQAQLEENRAQLEQTRAQLEENRAQLEQAQAQLEENQAQLKQTQARLEQAQAELEQTRGQLEQTQAQLEQVQAELGQTQAQLEQTQAHAAERSAQREVKKQTLAELQGALTQASTLTAQLLEENVTEST